MRMKRNYQMIVILIGCFLFLCASALGERLIIPTETEEIAKEAFYGDTSLDEVVLPDGIKTIGDFAFAESSLRKINLPDSLNTIGTDALGTDINIEISAEEGSMAYQWALDHGFTPGSQKTQQTVVVPMSVNFPKNISGLEGVINQLKVSESSGSSKKTVTALYPNYRIYAFYDTVTGKLSTTDDVQLDGYGATAGVKPYNVVASYNHKDQLINRCFVVQDTHDSVSSVEWMDWYGLEGGYYCQRLIRTADKEEAYYFITEEGTTKSFFDSDNMVEIPQNTWMHIVVEDGTIITCEETPENEYTHLLVNIEFTDELDILNYPNM